MVTQLPTYYKCITQLVGYFSLGAQEMVTKEKMAMSNKIIMRKNLKNRTGRLGLEPALYCLLVERTSKQYTTDPAFFIEVQIN